YFPHLLSLFLSSFPSLLLLPLSSPLFPYTTLFRSFCSYSLIKFILIPSLCFIAAFHMTNLTQHTIKSTFYFKYKFYFSMYIIIRSEEHTSELQSRFDLVCRLLLEKKNITMYCIYVY